MKVITLLNEKGGVGKTTLAVHIAAGLAIRGARVVIVDADPQGNATMAVNVPKRGILYELVHPERLLPWDRALVRVDEAVYTPEPIDGTLYIVPGNVETRNIATSIDDVTLLKKRLMELDEMVDYIIIDTSPTPSLLHSSIYIASDYIVLPTECESYSMKGGLIETARRAANVRQLGEQQGLNISNIIGIVPNKFRRNTLTHEESLKVLYEEYGDLVWDPIKLRIVYAEAAMMEQLVYVYAPESAAAKDMFKLSLRVHRAAEQLS